MSFSIENMQPADWPAVRAIYAEGIASGMATFETSAPGWDEWHAAHLTCCRFIARAAGGEFTGQVAGWAALSPVSRRAAYAGVAEVSIYLAGWARGQGLGKTLLGKLIEASEQAGLWTLQASIFAVNEASLGLHQSCGFRLVGRRERIAQREGIWHDTLILERRSTRIAAVR
jgi:phosphinothricin acetyltransferase